jgi:hypothetical protein
MIYSPRHGSTKGIDFFHQVALADTPNSRVARHLTERLNAVRNQQRVYTHTRSGQCRFCAGMASTDHDDVIFNGVTHCL